MYAKSCKFYYNGDIKVILGGRIVTLCWGEVFKNRDF